MEESLPRSEDFKLALNQQKWLELCNHSIQHLLPFQARNSSGLSIAWLTDVETVLIILDG